MSEIELLLLVQGGILLLGIIGMLINAYYKLFKD